MTAFQSAELAYFYDLYSKEIERVRFYSDLSKHLDGNCNICLLPEKSGIEKVVVRISYRIGAYYPEKLTTDDTYDDALLIPEERKEMYFYIPENEGEISEYKNTYKRYYGAETITTMAEFAFDALKRIEAAKAAYEMTVKQDYSL